ncbi:hypothetical protein C2G38_2170114 [Gigaspora rosea]|uniref:Uncharacterized protein n=1 Tax=Gigaspora rosea TaxID=44941 RepID=A0A397VMX6_9GLOM|nr:hypothetical protein C2G38_2170114 [Gigaspora rosea]
MSAASNVNTYSFLEATEHIIDSVEMQIDNDVNKYKCVKLSSVKVTLAPTTKNVLLEEAVAETKKAARKVDDQHIATDNNSMLVTGGASEKIDKMKTELIGTIEEEKGTDPIPTYSAILKTAKLKENRVNRLKTETWTIDKIIEAFKNESALAILILDKCCATPMMNKLSQLIYEKFKNKDTTFFKLFNRQKELCPQHQQNFLYLLVKTLTKYKAQHEVLRTNKNNRDEIFAGLKLS